MRSENSPVDLAIPFVRPAGPALAGQAARNRLAGARTTSTSCSTGFPPTGTARLLSDPFRAKTSAPGETLAAILLGPAYQLGLVRSAEEDAERSASGPAHAAGSICPGARPAAAAEGDLRPLPFRPAQLRGHRLSTGAHAEPDRPVQPVRPLVAGGRGAGAKAHARFGLSRARRGPDDRRDARSAGQAQFPTLPGRAWPRRCGPGRAVAIG